MKKSTISLIALVIISGFLSWPFPAVLAQTASSLQGYSLCVSENGFCGFSGAVEVKYGAGGVYATKTLTGGTACNNATFGDPIYGTVKACYTPTGTATYATNPSTPPPAPSPSPSPSTSQTSPELIGFTFCATEGTHCSFTGTIEVKYGANGIFARKTLTDGTPCDNATFGDPVYGSVKSCYFYIDVFAPPPPPSPSPTVSAPTIISIAPTSVIANTATTLAVSGTNLQPGFSASVSTSAGTFSLSSSALSYASSTLVYATVSMGDPLSGQDSYTATLSIIQSTGQASGNFTVNRAVVTPPAQPPPPPPPITVDRTVPTLTSFGSISGFNDPAGVNISTSGNIYVADYHNDNVKVFDANLRLIQTLGSTRGSANGFFSEPWDVTFDSLGDALVTDTNNARIQVFDSGGRFLKSWSSYQSEQGLAYVNDNTIYATGRAIKIYSKDGTETGSPALADDPYPRNVASDANGRIYYSNWGNASWIPSCCTYTNNYLTIHRSDGSLVKKIELNYRPSFIDVDDRSRIWIVDTINVKVKVYDSEGSYLTEFSFPDIALPPYDGSIVGLEVNNDKLYITSFRTDKVHIYTIGTTNGTPPPPPPSPSPTPPLPPPPPPTPTSTTPTPPPPPPSPPAQAGQIKWQYAFNYRSDVSPAIASDGTIYFGSYDHYFHAVNPDGTLKWKYLTGDIINGSPAIGSDGTIYIGAHDRKLYALNPNGTTKWTFLAADIISSSPAVGSDGTIYFVSRYDGVYALNPNGTQKWKFVPSGLPTFSAPGAPVVGSDGTVYLVGTTSNGLRALFALNATNGSVKWQYTFSVSAYQDEPTPAIGSNGAIYIIEDTKLYAISSTGTLLWSKAVSDGYSPNSRSAAIAADGTIYVSGRFKLDAYDPNGVLKWSAAVTNIGTSSPAVGADGMIYVGSDSGNPSYSNKVTAVNPNGAVAWVLNLPSSGQMFSSPNLASDGTLYIVGRAIPDYLYAIQTSSLGLANSPWPKFRKDTKNTGRY